MFWYLTFESNTNFETKLVCTGYPQSKYLDLHLGAFGGTGFLLIFFWKHYSVRTKKLHNKFKKKIKNVLHKGLLLQDWVFRLGNKSNDECIKGCINSFQFHYVCTFIYHDLSLFLKIDGVKSFYFFMQMHFHKSDQNFLNFYLHVLPENAFVWKKKKDFTPLVFKNRERSW